MTCKFKNFLMLLVSISITSLIFICFFIGDQRNVDIHSFVTETHKQFKNLQERFPYSYPNEKRLVVEEKYLTKLGLQDDLTGSKISDHHTFDTNKYDSNKGNIPIVIVSAISKDQAQEEEDFIKNIESVLPYSNINIWSLDPTSSTDEDSYFTSELRQFCNSTKCSIELFPFDDFPDHIRDNRIHGYRPIILQSMLWRLSKQACVLWLDINRRFLTVGKDSFEELLQLALKGGSEGIVGWSSSHPIIDFHMTHPTSALTHPKTFSYFDTNAENYYFHRMIDPAQLLLCNTETVHSKIMLPWIKCTLLKECISPFGAQSTGCRFDKKPLYRYSGCHAYDSSVLNVALGGAFPLHQPYIARAPISRPSDPIILNLTANTS